MTECLVLAPGLAGRIMAHARSGYPQEVCGLVAGREGVAYEVYPGRNLAPDPARHFELDPDTLALQTGFAERGLELVAIYHSHPAGPATPSATDLREAYYPEPVYLICGGSGAGEPELRAWRLAAGEWHEVCWREAG